MVNQKDIARELGTSVSTVSRALNGSREISPEMTEKVLETADRLAYHQHARSSSETSEGRMAGIIVPEIMSEYYAQIIHLATDALAAKGYSNVIKLTGFQENELIASVASMRRIHVKCLLIVMDTEETMNERIVRAIRHSGCAVMLITSRHYPMLDFDCIHLDEYSGIMTGIQHLLQRGYQRIGCISDKISASRLTVFKQVLNLSGIRVDPQLICVGDERAESGGYLRMKELLSLRNPPDAVFCSYDQMAVGAIHALRESGLRMPEDVAILGFDNIPVAQYIEGGLTTIANPREDLISIAVNVLTKRVNHQETSIQQIALRPHLIVRNTT